MSEPPLLTVQQVADLFGVSESSVTRWARIGRIVSVRTPGGSLRFRREDVQAFLVPQPESEGAA